MARAIPHIDTKVDVEKTVSEIEASLLAHNASHIAKEYELGQIKAMAFRHGNVPFQLPAKVEAVYQILIGRRREFLYQEDKERIYGQAPKNSVAECYVLD